VKNEIALYLSINQMGIKGLKQWLRSKFPQCLVNCHISHWRGCKVALDLLPYMYRYKVSYGELWKNGLCTLLGTFIRNGVHVTVIMDGPMVYKEKDEEREKRKENRDKIRSKRDQLQLDLEQYLKDKTVTPLLLSVSESTSSHRNLLLSEKTVSIDVECVRSQIDKLKHQLVSITPDNINTVQALCKILYIPFVFARQEAESYASYLCQTGQVDAVVTEDTDTLTYGASVWLSSITHEGWCTEIRLDDIYKETGLNASQFIDFCILCGCDYNESLKGVGPVSAYKAMLEHKSAPVFLEKHDATCVRYDIVRNIFDHPCTDVIISKEIIEIKKIIISYNSRPDTHSITRLKKHSFPTQWLMDWLKKYDTWFDLE
jgi:flap endonuclease-1